MFIVPVSRRATTNLRGLDRLFDDAFDRFLIQPAAADTTPVRRPALDVSETDAAYLATLDVPGVSREDVKVSIDGRRVSLVAEARTATTGSAPEANTESTDAPRPAERAILRERATASFARSFTLPAEIDQSASQAKLDNGVLTLTLVKRQASTTQLAVN